MSRVEPWKRNLWVLWTGVILSSASYTMVVPFLPLFLLQLGVSKGSVNMWSGVVFSITFLVGAIMAPIWGSLADKYGKRKMIMRAGLSLFVVYGLSGLVQNPWELLLVRILHGFVSGFVPASMAIVASTTPEERMGWSLGIMQTAGSTGGILGPILGGVLSQIFGMRWSFGVASLSILLATIAVWLWVKEDHVPVRKEKQSSVLEDLKTAWHNKTLMQMLVLLFIVQISVMILQPLMTLYIAELQGSTNTAALTSGIVFSLVGIAGILAAPRWGKIGQNRGYRNTLLVALLGSGVLSCLQIATSNIWGFGVLRFVYGLFIAGVIPAINAMVVESTDSNFRGRAFGLTTSANQSGAMVGPLIGGALGTWMNIQFVFAVTGALLLVTGVVVWNQRRAQSRRITPNM